MPKFLIISPKGFLTTANKLNDCDYKKADAGEIRIILLSENPEQYRDKKWAVINPYRRDRKRGKV